MVKFLDKRRTPASGGVEAGAVEEQLSESLTTAPPAPVKVNVETGPTDPVDILIGKTFQFILDQPEFYQVLQLPKYERKRLERAVAKMLTRFPHMTKVLNG